MARQDVLREPCMNYCNGSNQPDDGPDYRLAETKPLLLMPAKNQNDARSDSESEGDNEIRPGDREV